MSGEIRPVCGILNIDKPAGMTSQAVVSQVRRLMGGVKAGHTGTLDPMATGVLPVLLGRATVFAEFLLEKEKCYTAGVQLGLVTDTEDVTGAVLEKRDASSVTRAALEQALGAFRGEIMQIPPMYSALKRDGKKLCDLAREGITVAREPRPVQIHALELLEFDPAHSRFVMAVRCSKGTYIRTLAADIGAALGCGAAMDALRRTAAGPFSAEKAVTPEQLAEAAARGQAEELVIPVETVFGALPAVAPEPFYARLLQNGLAVEQRKLRACFPEGQLVRAERDGVFLGLLQSVQRDGAPCLKFVRQMLV